MQNMAKIFKALSDENRLKIFLLINKRKICAKGISKFLKVSESAVSQHIRILKDANLVIGEKIGYHMKYNTNKDTMNEIIKFVDSIDDIDLLSANLNCETTCKCIKNRCCEK